jgi:FKBP-type peptidyl-prolyl cis-trans isomerase (trigger factor)
MKKYKILGSKVLPDSEVEIECEIEAETVAGHRAKAIAKFQKDVSLPGFRPGHVPEAMLVKHVGEFSLYQEMAEMAINDAFPDILAETKTNYITMPQIQLTKIAEKNPVIFKILGPVMPEIKLANYKKIAEKENKEKAEPVEATDKELDETIEEIRKNYALKNHTHPTSQGSDGASAEKCDHDNLPLPELNEEWVKKLGGFATVEDFKNRIKESIKKEKEFKAKDKKRLSILEKIIADSKITMPKILVENELRKMQAQFEDDIARAGLKVEDYLKHLKKTPEDLKKEWAPDAEKRAKVQLIITKIALDEKIEADPEVIKKEVENLLKTYKDATEDRTKAYVEMMLTNEKVLEWLENQK